MCNSDIIGVGNSGIERPYKKVEVGKEEFKHIVENANVSKQSTLIEELINFLKSRKRYIHIHKLYMSILDIRVI